MLQVQSDGFKVSGLRKKRTKYYTTITKDNVVHQLRHSNTLELAVCAYNANAVEYHKEKVILNLPDCREYAQLLLPENIRICTMAKEKENHQVKQQLFNPLVMELARDEKLLETNKMMFLEYAMRKSAHKDPVDWDNLGQRRRRRCSRYNVILGWPRGRPLWLVAC
ncbi:UMP-CMP kinase [Hordeum vulgare]|nr:UMP-CMP kinase [Hordeum vulgare]